MNSLNDLVSIVIPVYNSEEFLRESIDSVLNQTYQNLEIIAVNDGSTDNSQKILNEYSDKITIISQSNQGLAAALKAGIEKINGKWLKWFSPDDILYPNAIEILVKESKKLPENTIVYSNWEIIDEKGMKLRDFHESDYNDLEIFDFNVRLLDGQQINVNTTLIPKILFDKGYSFQNLENPIAIDYDFFLRAGIIYNTKFFLISKSLLSYRISKNQLSHKKVTKTLSYLSKVRQDILSKLDKSEQKKYQVGLENYSKRKSITKKVMEMGLKISSATLPDWLSDKILVFYLNNLRRNR